MAKNFDRRFERQIKRRFKTELGVMRELQCGHAVKEQAGGRVSKAKTAYCRYCAHPRKPDESTPKCYWERHWAQFGISM